jgi:hypothetical protein
VAKILSEVTEAELLLQTAYFAWQNSSNNSRYLLSGEELKKVLIAKKLQPVLQKAVKYNLLICSNQIKL